MDDATWIATCGSVEAATQRDKLLQYLCEKQGCVLLDLRAPTISAALEDESLEEATKSLLRIRLEASKTSVSKFKRLGQSVGKGDRLRGTMQYSGAARTARWAGRIFQPHNLTRPTMQVKGDDPNFEIRQCIEWIRNGEAEKCKLLAPLTEAASNSLRGLIVAPAGKTLNVADYSAVEGCVNAWLAGEDWKVKAFREKKDIYCRTYEKVFGLAEGSITKKNTTERGRGKVIELFGGFGGGVGAFVNMALALGADLEEIGRATTPVEKAIENWEKAVADGTTFGLTREVYTACDTLKIGYRQANPAITQSWYMYENAAKEVINRRDPNHKVHVGLLTFDCNNTWMRIKLPSSRFLCYALPRIQRDGSISYSSWRNKKWSRTKTYGGKLCIAEGTPILTEYGWLPIEQYVRGIRLWDGVQWVYGGNLLDNGYRETIEYSGVRMTEDHDVLTKDGWRPGIVAQSKGLDRAEVPLPDSSPFHPQQRWQDVLAGSVHLRESARSGRGGAVSERKAPFTEKLRLQNQNADWGRQSQTWYDESSSICGVAFDDRSLLATNAPSLAQLRCARYHGLPSVGGVIRSFLERYGSEVSNGVDDRTQRQQQGLLKTELPLEKLHGAGEQQAQQRSSKHQMGQVDSSASVPQGEPKSNDGVLPHQSRLAGKQVARVYDIENVGPLQRFTVQGANGEHLIVHNCENIVQAVARDLLAHAILLLHDKGFEVVLHIHDEVIAEVLPENSIDEYIKLVSTKPRWAVGLPLSAEGFQSTRYEKR